MAAEPVEGPAGDAAVSPAGRLGPARRAVLLAGAAGQVSAAVAGVLPWQILPVAVVLLAVAAATARRAGPTREAALQRLATGLVALAGTVVMAAFALAGPGPFGAPRVALGALLVVVQTVQALAWRSPRELRVGVLCAVGLLVLSASFAPDVLVGAPLLFGWAAAVRAGAVVSHTRLGMGADVLAVPAPADLSPSGPSPSDPPSFLPPRAGPAAGRAARAVTAGTVGVTVAALTAGLAGFLVVPVPTGTALRNRLAQVQAAGTRAAGAAAFADTRLDLRTRGALTQNPVLSVPDRTAGLWRSNVFAVYDGLGWSDGNGLRRVTGTSPFGPPRPAGRPADGARTVPVTVLGPRLGVVWAPGEPLAVSGPGVTGASSDGQGTLRAVGGPAAYDVVTLPQVTDPAVLRAAAGPDPADRRWLQVPPSMPASVGDLARTVTAGAASRFDRVASVTAWLGANAAYQLDSPVPADGQDAVDRFLQDKVGFCEQFASAEVMMLRSVGIPARFVTGLAYGTAEPGGSRLFREADLHAWAEVFYPGVGWSPVDPTAGAQIAQATAAGTFRQQLAGRVAQVLQVWQRGPGGRAGIAAELVATALLGTVASRARRHARRRRSLGRGTGSGARAGGGSRVPGRSSGSRGAARRGQAVGPGPALAGFLRWNRRLGSSGRRPEETLAEMAARFEPAGPGPVGAALRQVEREVYLPGRAGEPEGAATGGVPADPFAGLGRKPG